MIPMHLIGVDFGEMFYMLIVAGMAGGTAALGLVSGIDYLRDWWDERRADDELDLPEPDTSGDPVLSQIPDEWSARNVADVTAADPEPVEVDDHSSNTTIYGWRPARKWCANSRTVHRMDCPSRGKSQPIDVWTAAAAAIWATGVGLKGCSRCYPFAPHHTPQLEAAR